MKKLLMFVVTALCALFIGCEKDLPSVEKMYTLTKTAGITAGYVANMTKISDKDRIVVIDVFNKVTECIPTAGQTFTDAWTPVAKKYIQELIDAGKIDATQGTLIEGVLSIATKAIDYVVFKKCPKVGEHVELVEAAAKGFTEGFLSVFTPPNSKAVSNSAEINKELYDYLTK